MLRTEHFDVRAVIGALANEDGIVSIPIVEPAWILTLHKLARESFVDVPSAEVQVCGQFRVRQQMSEVHDYEMPPESPFLKLAAEFQQLLNSELKKAELSPFETEPNFTLKHLLRYDVGSVGITPHKDPEKSRNLVVIFCIGGKGRLMQCKDRSLEGAVEIDTTPGNVILMRGPGFINPDRPFHCVTDVSETRYTFLLRDYKEVPEWYVKKNETTCQLTKHQPTNDSY